MMRMLVKCTKKVSVKGLKPQLRLHVELLAGLVGFSRQLCAISRASTVGGPAIQSPSGAPHPLTLQ